MHARTIRFASGRNAAASYAKVTGNACNEVARSCVARALSVTAERCVAMGATANALEIAAGRVHAPADDTSDGRTSVEFGLVCNTRGQLDASTPDSWL